MAMSLISMIESKLVTATVTAARPSGAGDGVDITSWRWSGIGIGAPAWAALFLDGSEAQTLASPTGGDEGPELWGYAMSQWWRIGVINNGADVAIAGATQGAASRISVIGIFDRLALAATPSVGTCTVKLVPIQESLHQ